MAAVSFARAVAFPWHAPGPLGHQSCWPRQGLPSLATQCAPPPPAPAARDCAGLGCPSSLLVPPFFGLHGFLLAFQFNMLTSEPECLLHHRQDVARPLGRLGMLVALHFLDD